MKTKKRLNSADRKTTHQKPRVPQSASDREKKILNCTVNTTILLMSTMMGALTDVMAKIGDAMTAGMAGAFGGKEAEEKTSKEIKQKLPEVDEKLRAMISDIRKDAYAQLARRSREMKALLADPKFDAGPRIVEKYDFQMPKLTEELDEETLAEYAKMLVSEDPKFAEMFKELAAWLNSLPQLPEKPNA